MTEHFILEHAPERVKERGYQRFRIVHRDLNLAAGQQLEIIAYNELWFVVHVGDGIGISSDYGEFDYSNTGLRENVHEHGDRISITNSSSLPKQAKFVQVLMQR